MVGLTFGTASGAVADDAAGPTHSLPHVVDGAGLLTADETERLEGELLRISGLRGNDVVILTVESLGDRTSTAYADDYFDYGPNREDNLIPGSDPEAGYGIGPDRSGVILLVSMGERDWAISTRGEAIDVLTDARQSQITDQVIPLMSGGQWSWAFESFAEEVDEAFRTAQRVPWEIVLLATLGAALIGGFVPVTIWKHQLKSVKPAAAAKEYLVGSSLVLTYGQDYFVGESTQVVDTESSSGGLGGGSSTHLSSSGASHGGSSGKF
ncbi:MAG: TPM domain-containing protein [Bifidobacteriaceae bacterium]|nr:TPM domain-containing protein [Bifidobacteriaceae bacterium]